MLATVQSEAQTALQQRAGVSDMLTAAQDRLQQVQVSNCQPVSAKHHIADVQHLTESVVKSSMRQIAHVLHVLSSCTQTW